MTFNRNLSLFVITILLVSVKSEDLKNDDDDETDESETETKNIADKRPPMTQFTYGDNDPLGKREKLNYIIFYLISWKNFFL